MKFLNVAEARLKLTKIIKQIEDTGEGVIVTRNGHPVVLMRAVNEEDLILKEEDKISQKKKRG